MNKLLYIYQDFIIIKIEHFFEDSKKILIYTFLFNLYFHTSRNIQLENN